MPFDGPIPTLDIVPQPVDLSSSSADVSVDSSSYDITTRGASDTGGRGRTSDDGSSNRGARQGSTSDSTIDPNGDNVTDPATDLAALTDLIDSLALRLNMQEGSLSSVNSWISDLNNAIRALNSINFGKVDAQIAALAENLMNNVYNFAVSSYTNDYSLQMWYLQQRYNTPLAQLQRLAEAGLNSAFITGDMNSGNAGQAAATNQSQGAQNSGAAQAGVSDKQAKTAQFNASLSGAAALLGALGGVGSSFGSILNGVASFKTAQEVNPSVIALNKSQELASQMSAAKALQDIDQMQMVQLDNQYQLETAAAQNEVIAANQARDTTEKYAFSDITETKYEVHVRDSSNRTHTRVMSIDELNAAVANGNRTSDGERLCDSSGNFISGETSVSVNAGKKASKNRDHSSVSSSDDRSITHYQEFINGKDGNLVKANSNDMHIGEGSSVTDALGLALGFSLEGGASQKASYGSNGSHSKETSSEFSYTSDTSGGLSKTSGFDYDEEGNVRVGNTIYHAVTTHRRVLNEKFKTEWESRLKRCQDAADHYASLTRGEKYKYYQELHTMARDAYRYRNNVMFHGFYRQLFR